MAARFDNPTDRLLRTASLIDYNANYAIMFWAYLTSDLNAISTFIDLNDNTDQNQDCLRTDSDGVTFQVRSVIGGTDETISGSVLSIGQWYHMALVRSGFQLRGYLNGTLDAQANIVVAGRTAQTRTEFGGRLSANSDRMDGRVASIKIWEGLTPSVNQIRTEMWQTIPLLSGPHSWYPCFPGSVERLRDYSQNGRTWTESGTLTDEAGPPIRWGLETSPKTLLAASAVVGRLKYLSHMDGLGTFFRGLNG